MSLQMKSLVDLIEDDKLTSFVFNWAVRIPGNLAVGIIVRKERVQELQLLFTKDSEAYVVYEYERVLGVILIHHLGTFSDCCATMSRLGF